MIGQTVSHYKILEILGYLCMPPGDVIYLAEDVDLRRKVVIRFLQADQVVDPELKSKVKQEAQTAAAFNHPNLLAVYEVAEYQDTCYIVMEYIDGKSVRDLLQEKGLSLKQALDIGIQVCEGLAKVHQAGMVHGNIKSNNILVNVDGQAKVLVFGLATLKGGSKVRPEDLIPGMMAYMSPEQVQGGEIDVRTDIFSFGVVLYEMITSRHPFEWAHSMAVPYSILYESPLSLARFNREVPPKLQEIVDRALAKRMEERFGQIEELLAELRHCKKEMEGGKEHKKQSPMNQ